RRQVPAARVATRPRPPRQGRAARRFPNPLGIRTRAGALGARCPWHCARRGDPEDLGLPDKAVLLRVAAGGRNAIAASGLAWRVRLPAVVGFLFSGVLIGPYVLGLAGTHRPIVEFAADLGKLMLMFFCGLEINLMLFRQGQRKSIIFGLLTTLIPLALGTAV